MNICVYAEDSHWTPGTTVKFVDSEALRLATVTWSCFFVHPIHRWCRIGSRFSLAPPVNGRVEEAAAISAVHRAGRCEIFYDYDQILPRRCRRNRSGGR